MDITRRRVGIKFGNAWARNLLGESCDWFAMSMFVAAMAAYTAEYWWGSKWFAFG